MKNLLLILLITISSLANAQSSKQRLEDIEDKLDMMQAEQDYRDAQKRIEQQNRRSDETPLQRQRRIRGEFSRIFKNENVEIYIQYSSIEKTSIGKNYHFISYVYFYEFSKPQYFQHKTYFAKTGLANVNCSVNSVYLYSPIYYDKHGKGFVTQQSEDFKTKGRLEEEIQKYLCR